MPNPETPILANVHPGEPIDGEGIYLCQREIIIREGRPLRQPFVLIAAPRDLFYYSERVAIAYSGAVNEVASLRNWYGHDGGKFEDETALERAFENGSYLGRVVHPTARDRKSILQILG